MRFLVNINLALLLLWLLLGTSLTLWSQANDHCNNASPLTVGTSCTNLQFDNISATEESGVAPEPSCGQYQGGDVWFTVEIPASGALRIETNNHAGSTPHAFSLYSGSCGNFEEVLCVQLDHEKTFYGPDLAGEIIYLRVHSYGEVAGSGFDLCVYEPEIPANDNCANAIKIDPDELCRLDLFSNAFATEESLSIVSNPSCGSYMGGDVWFTTAVPTSGILRVETRNLAGSTARSLVIYSGACGDFVELQCSQLNTEVNFDLSNHVGETVYIRVFSYLTEEGGGFEMCLWEPALVTNDNCENAIELTAGESCISSQFSNDLATAQSAGTAPDPTCGAYFGGDVWFKTEVPVSGYLTLETSNLIGSTSKSITIYRGTCGAFSELFCLELEDKGTFYDPNWAGETVYIRVFSYLTEEGGDFTLCAWNQACDQADNSITQSGLTLIANETNADYQWVNCALGHAPIDGATGRTFNVTDGGIYAVRITKNGCSNFSDCVELNVVATEEVDISGFKIYPNPVQSTLTVDMGSGSQPLMLELWSMKGQSLFSKQYDGLSQVKLDTSPWANGIYVLKIHTAKRTVLTKLIKP